MHVCPLPGTRAVIVIFLSVFLSGCVCFAGTFKPDSTVKYSNQPQKETLVYIGFVGRKMIKPLQSMEYVVEVYSLPIAIVKQMNKFQFSANRYDYKTIKKQQGILASLNDRCRVYRISDRVKYKYFYPQGLKKGMVISENEFNLWDFTKQIDVSPTLNPLPSELDSLTALPQVILPEADQTATSGRANNNRGVLKPGNAKPKLPVIVPGERAYILHPWNTEARIDSKIPYHPSFDHFIDSLFLHIANFSEYLGAQRIRLELYDQPFAADFYAKMYIHYVDSIVNVLKQKHQIKPGEYENFILYTSEIITNRFKYGENLLLWKGIRRNRLDCDNSSYLVYDIGKKLGFEVSIVFLWYHALVVTGDYAYETTRREYFPKEQLKDHYSTIFMITPDPKKIHAFSSIYEIALDLDNKKEYRKAEDFRKIGPKYFPRMKKPQ